MTTDQALALLGTLLDLTLRGTLLLALAGLTASLLRRASAATRHLVWCFGLCSLLVLPVLVQLVPAWTLPVLPSSTVEAPPAPEASQAAPAPAAPAPPAAPAAPAPGTVAERPAAPAAVEPPSPVMEEQEGSGMVVTALTSAVRLARSTHWTIWLVLVWLSGIALIGLRMAMGRLAILRLRLFARPVDDPVWNALADELGDRLFLRRPVRLLQTARVSSPLTWGVRKPFVVLPAEASGWSLAKRRCVLLHEFAHIKRMDCLTQSVGQVAATLFWFHPLAWVALRHMRSEREKACDDFVLTHGVRASEYASHLIDIARGVKTTFVSPFGSVAMAQPSQLEGRVVSILDPKRRRRAPRGFLRGLMLVFAVVLIGPLAALRPVQAGGDVGEEDRPASVSEARVVASAEFTKEFAWEDRLGAGESVEVRGVAGDVRAARAGGDKVGVLAVHQLSGYGVNTIAVAVVRHPGGVLVCALPRGSNPHRSAACDPEAAASSAEPVVPVDIHLTLPDSVHLVAHSLGGEVEARGLSGDVAAYTVDGDIEIETTGAAEARSVSGSIYALVGRTDWKGSRRIETVDGDIVLILPERPDADISARVRSENRIAAGFPLEGYHSGRSNQAWARLGRGGRSLDLVSEAGDIRIVGAPEVGARSGRSGDWAWVEEEGDRPAHGLAARPTPGSEAMQRAWSSEWSSEGSSEWTSERSSQRSSRERERTYSREESVLRVIESAVEAVAEGSVNAMLDEIRVKDLMQLGVDAEIETELRTVLKTRRVRDLSLREVLERLEEQEGQRSHVSSRAEGELEAALRRADCRASDEEIVALSHQGVDAEFVDHLRRLGFSTLSVEDLLLARVHDVDADFVRRVRRWGYDPSMEELAQLRIFDVDEDYLRGLARVGYADLDLEELIQFRIHEVSPDFIESLRDTGLGIVSAEEIVRLRTVGG